MVGSAEKTANLKTFVQWAAKHITGDEKGEAQVFLDRLFQGFGWEGFKEANAFCELRVKNTNGGTSFADLVWKPVVVIEMKKRGTDLNKHYSQAFTYWTRLVPNRPRFAILCNFDEFWIYDFETQLDTPVDKVLLKDLPTRFGPLNFMFPEDVKPIFGNHQETVTRKAADKLAACFNSLIARKVDQPLAQRFILQMLMALFSEDIGLLDKYVVTRLLDDCKTPQDTYDLLGGLFTAMNTNGVKGGRFKGVPYFNGGLFAQPAMIELTDTEKSLLRTASDFDWSKVRPEIFGTIFEHSLGKEQRHAQGAHYTSPVDIMKVVGPTIVAPWTERIEATNTLDGLKKLLARIESFTVLDPACGSGNFLYVAYRELKRLEARIYERMATEYKSVDPNQRPFGFVSAANFYGMDVNPFAVDIAKATMMLAHKLAIDELHISESALPLDNLDANFKVGDALVQADGTRTEWFETDVIVGNPPFLGSKLVKRMLGTSYVNRLRKAYPEVPGMADFCVYWFRRANDNLKPCTSADPFAGRAGLVGTQAVRSNASRLGGLDQIVASGAIIEAVENQPWSGEANVNVSIANWIKTEQATLLPKTRRLWFKVDPVKGAKAKPQAGDQNPADYELDMREVPFINSSLSDLTDVTGAKALAINATAVVGQGLTPGHSAFVLTDEERGTLMAASKKNADVIHPYMIGDDALSTGKPARWLLDFERKTIVEAQAYPVPLKRIQDQVLPDRMEKAKALPDGDEDAQGNDDGDEDEVKKGRAHHQAFLAKWWQLSYGRPKLSEAVASIPRYLACSRVTKRPIFFFVDSAIKPGDAMQIFALADDYSFGILQSDVHWQWFIAKCGKLTERPRYNGDSVFHTFPWPQAPTAAMVTAIANAGKAVRTLRAEAAEKQGIGLRALYRTLDLPGKNPLREAHEVLNAAVMKAYGFAAKKPILQQLLDLNLKVADRSAKGEPVLGPGVPSSYKNPSNLISSDCFST
ncbi:DNA methyltransferase [Diaphorobacter nitroreducens]|uniref:DNA methyltransferase n=1 Tax=Diaphorobacter nitroreducens TaxID=164759 RepID=UPI00289EC9B8|nr:type IIL restriction-modification enzyme MmeI [Diaphorobacter nitroreducens]